MFDCGWRSDVCSSDLRGAVTVAQDDRAPAPGHRVVDLDSVQGDSGHGLDLSSAGRAGSPASTPAASGTLRGWIFRTGDWKGVLSGKRVDPGGRRIVRD